MFSAATPLVSFFERCYVPDRLAGPEHAASRREFKTQIGKLQTWFDIWLAEQGLDPRPFLLSDFEDPKVCKLKLSMHWWVERGGNAASTANKLYRHVKAIWNLAWAHDLVTRQCRTKAYRVVKREPRAWLPEEVHDVVRASFLMPGYVGHVPARDWWPALILTTLSIGSRITATMAIETQYLDLARGEVLLLGETQKQRSDQPFDLLPSAVDALERLAPFGGQRYVFGDWPSDGDRSWRTLRAHLKRLLVAAGLFDRVEDVTRDDLFHKFRRCVATEIAIKQGIDAARLYMGHSSTAVTERYIDKRRLVRPKANEVLTDPLPPGELRVWNEAS